jgi:hypothetical protein
MVGRTFGGITFMTSTRAFWVSLAVLFALHTVVSFASYRLFTFRSPMPSDGAPLDITTPEQRAAGERSFRVVTGRRLTPMPVVFYICGGFAALGAATLFMVYTRLRAG